MPAIFPLLELLQGLVLVREPHSKDLELLIAELGLKPGLARVYATDRNTSAFAYAKALLQERKLGEYTYWTMPQKYTRSLIRKQSLHKSVYRLTIVGGHRNYFSVYGFAFALAEADRHS